MYQPDLAPVADNTFLSARVALLPLLTVVSVLSLAYVMNRSG